MQGKWIKIAAAAIAVPVVTVSAFHLVRAYEAGTTFQPVGSGRDLQVNQVVFSGDEDTAAQKDNTDQNGERESELWEKDKTAEDSLSPNLKNNANYLFQTGKANLPDGTESINLAGEEAAANNAILPGENTNQTGNGNYVYDITEDTDNADLVISGNGQGAGSGTGNGNGAGTGNSTGKGQGENIPAGTPKPSEPPKTPAPTSRPADTVIDPEPEKAPPSWSFGSAEYNEKNVDENSYIGINASESAKSYGSYLYQGQMVTEKDLFNCLETYVIDFDFNTCTWGMEHYNKYIRIAGVSFDGGKSYITEYPVRIPDGLQQGEMKILVEYRIHQEDKWLSTQVDYMPAGGRVYALKRKLTENFQTLTAEDIANLYGQYPEADSIMNLYQYQAEILGYPETTITKLFPGWTENGQQVSWLYPVKSGRHILEPMDMEELPEEYVVKMKNEYIPAEYYESSIPHPLQTLTWYDGKGYEMELKVPEGIQAVDIQKEEDLEDQIWVDTLMLPDSVICVNTLGRMIVFNNYVVDEKNPCLYADENGILYNKAENQILGIPFTTYDISVPSKVGKVIIPSDNMLMQITLETTDAAEIPEMNLENAQDCTISLKNVVLNDFADKYEDDLENHQMVTEDGTAYTVQSHAVIAADTEELRYVLKSASVTFRLSDNIKSIGPQALSGAGTTGLVMPANVDKVILQKDCLKGSSVKVIWCHNDIQKQNMEAQLALAGAGTESVEVKVMSERTITTKQGYTYVVTEPSETAKLVKAPDTITFFDGVVKADDGMDVNITSIGENAFKNNTALEWVLLPQNIKSIGADAFRGCTALQGILIDSRDEVTIGNNAFAGCSALRFIAANAPAIMTENHYVPKVTDEQGNSVFYIPSSHSEDAECFWNQNEDARVAYFDEATGIAEYSLEKIGDSAWMLYGVDYFGRPWLALRSGSQVDESVILPAATQEIYSCAMYQTNSQTGIYTINWEDLFLLAIDDYAFYHSGVAGEVGFGQDGYYSFLMEHAFDGCSGITEITMGGTIYSIEQGCFANCTKLEKVTLGIFEHDAGDVKATLHWNMFSGCPNFKQLVILDETPPRLWIPTKGYSFRFLGYEEDMEKEKGILVVPVGSEQNYLAAWKYQVLGYKDDAELEEAGAKEASPSEWKAAKIEEGQRRICDWLGIEYTGNTDGNSDDTDTTDPQVPGPENDQVQMPVADDDSTASVSDGNAQPEPSDTAQTAGADVMLPETLDDISNTGSREDAGENNSDSDLTQEETIQ